MLTPEQQKLLPEIEKALNQVNFLCESIKDTEVKLLMLIKGLIDDKPTPPQPETTTKTDEVK